MTRLLQEEWRRVPGGILIFTRAHPPDAFLARLNSAVYSLSKGK